MRWQRLTRQLTLVLEVWEDPDELLLAALPYSPPVPVPVAVAAILRYPYPYPYPVPETRTW